MKDMYCREPEVRRKPQLLYRKSLIYLEALIFYLIYYYIQIGLGLR